MIRGQAHVVLRFFLIDTGAIDVVRSDLFVRDELVAIRLVNPVPREHLDQLTFRGRGHSRRGVDEARERPDDG